MTVTINGTTGIAGTNGSAGTPAVQGEDTNTGIFFPAADTVAVATGGAERVRVDSSGNVLVGTTTSSDSSFSVQANGAGGRISAATGANSNAFRFSNTNTTSQWSFGTNSPGIQNAGDYVAIGRLPSGGSWAEALRIDSSGNLLVGTTVPDGRLTVANGSVQGPIASLWNSRNVSGDQVFVLKNGANANNTSSYYLICQEAGIANRMFIYGNGNVVNTNNSYGALSDEKLKENIIDSGSQWDDMKAVRVRKYSLKADNADGPNQIGVIAQELEAAGMGGLVFESPDLGPDNQPTGETIKQVNYSVLYMKAVKALQEAMARIETLEAKVNALEAK